MKNQLLINPPPFPIPFLLLPILNIPILNTLLTNLVRRRGQDRATGRERKAVNALVGL